MAISELIISPRIGDVSTGYPQDVNQLTAKINEVAIAMGISPLTLAAAVGAGDPAEDFNTTVKKVNEIIGTVNGSTPTTPAVTTPTAPNWVYSSASRGLSLLHTKYSASELEYSHDGGLSWISYAGTITIDSAQHDYADYIGRVKAATGRTVSENAFSPQIAPVTTPAATKATTPYFGVIDDVNNIVSLSSAYAFSEVRWGVEGQGPQALASNSICSPGNIAGRLYAYVVADAATNRLQSDTVYSSAFSLAASANNAPTATLSVAGGTSSVTPGQSIVLQLSATDPDVGDSVIKIELLDNGVKIGEVSGASGSLQTPGLSAGTHSFTARATDSKGGTGLSTAVLVTAQAASVPGFLDFATNSTGFLDSPYAEQKAGWVQRSAFARVILRTDYSTLSLRVQCYGNGLPQSQIGYKLNGVRQAPIQCVHTGNTYPTASFQTLTLNLPALQPGQYNVIELTEGTTLYLENAYGANVSLVSVTGTGNGTTLTTVSEAAKAKRVFFNFDSIGVSAENDEPTRLGSICALRDDPAMVDWSFATDGAAGAYDDNRFASAAQQAAHVQAVVNYLSGAYVGIYFDEVGTNALGATPPVDVAAFKAKKASIVDAIRTAAPTVKHLLQGLFYRNNFNPSAYRTAVQQIAADRPAYAVYLDASNILTSSDLKDGTHPLTVAEVNKITPQWKAWILANATASTGTGIPGGTPTPPDSGAGVSSYNGTTPGTTPTGTELVVGPTVVENNELNRKPGSGYTIVYTATQSVPGSSGAGFISCDVTITAAFTTPYEGALTYNVNSYDAEITFQDSGFVGTGIRFVSRQYTEGADIELIVDGVSYAGTLNGSGTSRQVILEVLNMPYAFHTATLRLRDWKESRKYVFTDAFDITG